MSYYFVEDDKARDIKRKKGRKCIDIDLSAIVEGMQYSGMPDADLQYAAFEADIAHADGILNHADRLDQLRPQGERGEELTRLAFGYRNGQMVANQVFPVIGVTKERGFVRQFGKEEFRYHPSKRAIHAHTNLIRTSPLEPLEWKLDEYDKGEPVDYREESESDNTEEARAAKRVSNMLFNLDREIRVATLVQNTALYTNGNTGTPTIKWNVANSTPVDDIHAAREVVRGNLGVNPDTLLFGAKAWYDIRRNPQILGLTGVSTTRVVTLQVIKDLLEIENIIVGDGIYIDDAGVVHDIWGDTATLFYGPRGNTGAASESLPGFGYTLQKKLWPAIDTYDKADTGGKVKIVRATSIEGQFFLGNIAGYHFTNTRS